MTTGRALVIGDEYTLSRHQEQFLKAAEIDIVHVPADETQTAVLDDSFDVAIAGFISSGPDLSDAVREIFRVDPELPIILIADDLRMREAYAVGQHVAFDCIPRVVDDGWLLHKIKLAIMQRQLLLENRALSIGSPDADTEAVVQTPLGDTTLPADEVPGALYQSSEKRVILEALGKTRWNRRQAAKLLGISYNTLRRRIDRYHLNSTSL
jgi:DNA-binding NtrC family response regulator